MGWCKQQQQNKMSLRSSGGWKDRHRTMHASPTAATGLTMSCLAGKPSTAAVVTSAPGDGCPPFLDAAHSLTFPFCMKASLAKGSSSGKAAAATAAEHTAGLLSEEHQQQLGLTGRVGKGAAGTSRYVDTIEKTAAGGGKGNDSVKVQLGTGNQAATASGTAAATAAAGGGGGGGDSGAAALPAGALSELSQVGETS